MEILTTGFGPFLDIAENPSAQLARSFPLYEILEVSFAAVDDFFQSYDFSTYDCLLMIGVSASAKLMRLETLGRNWCGPTPDVRGDVRGPGPIDPATPFQLASTLWTPEWLAGSDGRWEASSDAGDYLCNYALFRALQTLTSMKVGFLHIPLLQSMEFETQKLAVSDFRLQICEAPL